MRYGANNLIVTSDPNKTNFIALKCVLR